MAGFGTMPFGVGPFGTTYSAPLPSAAAQIPSARNIDAFGRFTQNDDLANGGFDGMSDNMQRALVLLGLGQALPDKFVADFSLRTEADIRQALAPLSGVVAIEAITVTDNGASLGTAAIELRDLESGQTKVFKPTV
jgi:hypothetical protein